MEINIVYQILIIIKQTSKNIILYLLIIKVKTINNKICLLIKLGKIKLYLHCQRL